MRLSKTVLFATASAALALASAGGATAAVNAAPGKAGGATPALTRAAVTTSAKPAPLAAKAVAVKPAAPGHAPLSGTTAPNPPQHILTTPKQTGVSTPARAFDATIAQKALPSTFTTAVTLDRPIAVDTSGGKTCPVNKAEVTIDLNKPPVRFNAEFKLDQKIAISHSLLHLRAAAIRSQPGSISTSAISHLRRSGRQT